MSRRRCYRRLPLLAVLLLCLGLGSSFPARAVPVAAAETARLTVALELSPATPQQSFDFVLNSTAFTLTSGTPDAEKDFQGLTPGRFLIQLTANKTGQRWILVQLGCSSQDPRTTISVRLKAAWVQLNAGDEVRCTFTLANEPLDQPAKQVLAERFAPDLRFDARERFFPLTIAQYLKTAVLKKGRGPGAPRQSFDGTDAGLPRQTLNCLKQDSTCSYFLDVVGSPTSKHPEPRDGVSPYLTLEQHVLPDGAARTIYWNVATDPKTDRVAVQYWFFYLYNDFADRHEADWEQVTVFLDPQLRAQRAVYAAHHDAYSRPWGRMQRLSGTRRPVVYVARGSHASYFTAAVSIPVPICMKVLGRQRCITPSDRAAGVGVDLQTYKLAQLGGQPFMGDWGSGNFVASGTVRVAPPLKHIADHVMDPRGRPEFTDPWTWAKAAKPG